MVGEHNQEAVTSTEQEENNNQEHTEKLDDQESITEENANETNEKESINRENIDEGTTDDVNTDEATEENLDEISLEELRQENERLKKEKEETYDRMLRIQAEFENYKKRTQREKLAERKYRSQDLANELLPALDNFERALAIETTEENKSIIEGISMVYRQIQDALKSEGIKEIEAEGEKFDPNLHHAVMQVEDENKESNIVVEELQKGYILEDRVIRPAMVKVNK